MQQNSWCRLWGERGKMINHIISKCSKLAQKEYKTRHSWVCKVIHWELCKKFKFDRTNKWYMLNPESVLEIETRKLHRDFEIQTDHLISAKRSDLVIINKKIYIYTPPTCGLCCPGLISHSSNLFSLGYWVLFQVLQLKLVSPSPSYPTDFVVLWQDPNICLSFRFYFHSLVLWNSNVHEMTGSFFYVN